MQIFEASTAARLFDPRLAFEHPLTLALVLAIAGTLLASGILILVGRSGGWYSEKLQADLSSRWWSWCWLILAITFPIFLGGAWTILAVCLLSIFCYREYARTVEVQHFTTVNLIVLAAAVTLAFGALDHFDRLCFSCSVLGTGLIVIAMVLPDQPSGFVRRTALCVFGFLMFVCSLGYLSLMTNAVHYRPLLLCLILAVEANDVFAYCCGKLMGGPKLIPNTSPGKTVAGAVGACLLTTLLVAVLFHFLYRGTAVDRIGTLICLGLLTSLLGQLGDLTLSAIKRDVGIKDFGTLIPGHGGLLDRFDSLVFVPPAIYHSLSLILGPLGGDQPVRLISGGG